MHLCQGFGWPRCYTRVSLHPVTSIWALGGLAVTMIYERPVHVCSSSFFFTPSRFPGKATRKWVPPCPSLVCFDPHSHPISPEPRLFLKNSSTRSWTTSSTIPPPFVVASWPRRLSCRHVATISPIESYSDSITFQPGRSPSPIHRPALPHMPVKCISALRPTRRHGSQSTCRTFPTSAISP